jgi:glycosyltransferase involved in cell wall biosynthesis
MTASVRPPRVDIVIPVYDEEADLEPSVRRLRHFLDDESPFTTRITIADNAGTDGTWPIAQRLAADLPGVSAMWLARKGRGRALRVSASIAALHVTAPGASRPVEIVVLVAANAIATAVRFLVLRRFIDRPIPVTLA